MSPPARPAPELGDVIPLASGDGPAVWKVVGKRAGPDSVELELEHVETGQIAHRVMLVASNLEPGADTQAEVD